MFYDDYKVPKYYQLKIFITFYEILEEYHVDFNTILKTLDVANKINLQT